MMKSFWFNFFGIPVLIGLISLSIVEISKKFYNSPLIKDAINLCKKEDNDYVFSDIGTAQDVCIDDYMHSAWISEIFFIFFGITGIIFLVPLSIYFLFRLIKS